MCTIWINQASVFQCAPAQPKSKETVMSENVLHVGLHLASLQSVTWACRLIPERLPALYSTSPLKHYRAPPLTEPCWPCPNSAFYFISEMLGPGICAGNWNVLMFLGKNEIICICHSHTHFPGAGAWCSDHYSTPCLNCKIYNTSGAFWCSRTRHVLTLHASHA